MANENSPFRKIDLRWVVMLIFMAGACYAMIVGTAKQVDGVIAKTGEQEKRITTVETHQQVIRDDIKEIKRDVKLILRAR